MTARISAEQLATVLAALSAGDTHAEAARKAAVGACTVGRVARAHGIVRDRGNSPKPRAVAPRTRRALELVASGVPRAAVAERLGVQVASVHAAVLRSRRRAA